MEIPKTAAVPDNMACFDGTMEEESCAPAQKSSADELFAEQWKREQLLALVGVAVFLFLVFVIGVSVRLLLGCTLLGCGLYATIEPLFWPESFFRNWKTRVHAELLGYRAARLMHIALGTAITTVGLLILTGTIDLDCHGKGP